MAKKKKVSLDVFEEAVLPQLQSKHTKIDDLRTAIEKEYDIFEEGADGKEIQVKYSVSERAPALTEEETDDADEKLAAAVKSAVDEALKGVKGNAPLPQQQNPTIELKYYGRAKNFKRDKVNGREPNERAYRFGMWALACLGNENAKTFCATNGVVLKVQSEGTNTAGGYLVPDEFSTDLIDLRLEYGVFRANANVRSMSSDTLRVPRRTGGLTAYFVAENAAGTESTKAWDEVTLVAKDLMVIARMSAQVSADAIINLGDDLAGEIGYAFALKEDTVGFNGDGTSTHGGIQGVTTLLSSINGTDDGGGLVLGAGNTYAELTIANFHSVVGRVPTYARKGAKWYASPSLHDGVMQRLQTAAGGNAVLDIANGGVQKFLGYPVMLAEVLPTAEANSQICCLFGDLSKSSIFGDRQQESIDFSTQATVGGQSLWERNQIGIRGTERFDIVNHDLGTATAAGPVVGLILAAS